MKLVYPRKRCLAIIYIRLLLDDTALNSHQHRMKLVNSRECVCGHGTEDEDHFFEEALVIGTANQLHTANSAITSVCIADVQLPLADEIKVLGVVLDRRLAFDKHVMAVTRSCNFLRKPSAIYAIYCRPIWHKHWPAV